MKDFKLIEMEEKLNNKTLSECEYLIYQWIKTDYCNLKQFKELLDLIRL